MSTRAGPQPEGDRPPPWGLGLHLAVAGCLAFLVAGVLGIAFAYLQLSPPIPSVPPLPAAPASIVRPPAARVLIRRTDAPFAVECPDGGTWYGLADGQRRMMATEPGPWSVTSQGGRVTVDGAEQPEQEAELVPHEGFVRLGERACRGSLLFQAQPDGNVAVLNILDPEDYLRSVVGTELYSHWELDTLMAQAVAARTFMVYSMDAKGYLTLADMAYDGLAAESRSTDLATRLTEGIVLAYDGRILPAYFQSTCGGHTVPVDKMFAEQRIPPLAGVPCPWCRRSPWYEWEAEVPSSLIVNDLGDARIRDLRSLSVEGAGEDGYARYVVVNDTLKLSAESFRRMLGVNLVKSALFSATVGPRTTVFRGRGYGHGVGMCQWGAHGLARAGRTWQEILQTYYPGARTCKAW
jgi:stage II sporulation protein D